MSRAQPPKAGPVTNDAPSGSGLSSTAVVYPEISAQQQRRDDALVDFQQRRVTRRLDELERTNPTDIPASSFVPQQPTPASNIPGMPAGLIIAQPAKKKQTPNVRKILYAKKNLRDWLEELPSAPAPPYTLATSPAPPTAKARKICSSCGYIGAYKCPRCAEWSCDMVCMKVHARDGGCGVGM